MIPVKKNNVSQINLKITKVDDKKEISLKLMRKFELKDINKKETKIIKKANNLLKLYNKWDDKNPLKSICCNFPLLEEKCNEYTKQIWQEVKAQQQDTEENKNTLKM